MIAANGFLPRTKDEVNAALKTAVDNLKVAGLTVAGNYKPEDVEDVLIKCLGEYYRCVGL